MDHRARAFLRDLLTGVDTEGLSADLGHRGDRVSEWAEGPTHPTAAEVLRACQALDKPVRRALLGVPRPGAADIPPDLDPSAWLACWTSEHDPARLARMLGRPTATVRRWLGGRVRPRLGAFLAVVEASTGTVDALLDALLDRPIVDPRAAAHARTATEREAVSVALTQARAAWGTASVAVEVETDASGLAALAVGRAPSTTAGSAAEPTDPMELEALDDLDPDDEITVEVFPAGQVDAPDLEGRLWAALLDPDHATLGPHRPGWLEARTGLDADEVEQGLARLEARGAVAWRQDRWVPRPGAHIDPFPQSTPDPGPLQRLARARADSRVWSLSAADVARVRQLSRRTLAELHAIEASATQRDALVWLRPDP